MNTQQISDFVKQEISKGAPKERITQVLLINGVSQTEINQALSDLGLNISPPVPAEPTTPPPAPIIMPRKSHAGLIVTTVILLLLIATGGASAYVYMFQPELIKNIPLIGKLLNPAPTPEEALAKMLENLPQVKSLNYDLNFTGSGVVPTSTTTDSMGSVSIQMKGKSEMSDLNNPKNETTINIQGKIDSEGMRMSADFGASMIVLDKVFYGKINRLPTFIPIPELAAITGQWIKIDPKAMASSSSTPEFAFSTFGNPAEFGLTDQEMKDLKSKILEAKPIQFGEFIGEEDLNGKKTYNYPIAFSKPGLKNVLDIMFGLAIKIESKMNKPMAATSTKNLAEGMAMIKSYVDKTNFPEGKIWIGQDDFLPYKVTFENVNLPIPDEIKVEYPSAKVNLSLTMEYRDYNLPVDIKAPTSSKTIEEVMKGIMATSTSSSTPQS